MLFCQAERRNIRLEQAGVDNMGHPGGLCRLNHRLVLWRAFADLAAGDQKQRVDTGQCRSKRFRLVIIGCTHRNTEIGCFFR